MALLFYVIKVKQALFSKLMCRVYLHEMSHKKKAFQTDILEKSCAVVNVTGDTWKKLLFIEKLSCHTTRNIMLSL